jgi:hypothetical protein
MNYGINKVLQQLREINEETPIIRVNPSLEDINYFESKYDINLPLEYKKFLRECSDVNYSTLQPGLVFPLGEYFSLDKIMENGWSVGVPKNKTPFCEDNGDYFCFNRSGQVEFWSHDGKSSEKWSSFSEWILNVWLG